MGAHTPGRPITPGRPSATHQAVSAGSAGVDPVDSNRRRRRSDCIVLSARRSREGSGTRHRPLFGGRDGDCCISALSRGPTFCRRQGNSNPPGFMGLRVVELVQVLSPVSPDGPGSWESRYFRFSRDVHGLALICFYFCVCHAAAPARRAGAERSRPNIWKPSTSVIRRNAANMPVTTCSRRRCAGGWCRHVCRAPTSPRVESAGDHGRQRPVAPRA